MRMVTTAVDDCHKRNIIEHDPVACDAMETTSSRGKLVLKSSKMIVIIIDCDFDQAGPIT
jgi:hypothetical protein